ncbi:MAG: tetratricopeptide repeat protein [Elusimicrobia bacterium]|nr:tetratricopeptide repeat protein [Elusimicrobiota bacterium]
MRTTAPLAAFVLAAGIALAAGGRLASLSPRLPPLSDLPDTPYIGQDAALAAAGFRAAAADVAWIQLLEYAAGGLPRWPNPPGRPYAHAEALSRRVVRLDPYFHGAYLYGAGLLGWFGAEKHPDQAVALLQEGLRRDPGQRLYSLYIVALAYQKKGDVSREIAILESALDDPRTPTLMKEILANLFKSRREYAKALALWRAILDDPAQASQHSRARGQIREITALERAAASPAGRRQ